MLKGRLLRQKAINLEGDQKVAKILEQINTEQGFNSCDSDSDSTVTSTTDNTHRKNIVRNKKHITFKDRKTQSSSLNIASIRDAEPKSKFRTKSADEIRVDQKTNKLLADDKVVVKPGDGRSLEEVVQEFLLYFHDKRNSDKRDWDKRISDRSDSLLCEKNNGSIRSTSPMYMYEPSASVTRPHKEIYARPTKLRHRNQSAPENYTTASEGKFVYFIVVNMI